MDYAKLVHRPTYLEGMQFFIKKSGDNYDRCLRTIRQYLPDTKKTKEPGDIANMLIINDAGPDYPGMVCFKVPGTGAVCQKIENSLRYNGFKFGLYEQLKGGGIVRLYKPGPEPKTAAEKALKAALKKIKKDQKEKVNNNGPCAGCMNHAYHACLSCPDEFYFDPKGVIQPKPKYDLHTRRS